MTPDILCLGEPLLEFNQQPDGNYLPGHGGDTSNCAIAAARQGAGVGYITQVGADTFGQSFMSNQSLVDMLVKIVHRYDVMLMMEIKDAANESIWQLMDEVNAGRDSAARYDITISERLGKRTCRMVACASRMV